MRLTVAFLAIGEAGDSIVVTFDGPGRTSCIVIDGGNSAKGAKVLRDYLRTCAVEEIDLMVGTHVDQDHINGLKAFVRAELKAEKAGKPHVAVHHYWGPLPRDADDSYHPSGDRPADAGDSPTQRFIVESVQQHEDLLDALRSLTPAIDIRHPSRVDPPPRLFTDVKLEVLGPAVQISSGKLERKALSLGKGVADGGTLHDGDSLDTLAGGVSGEVEVLAAGLERLINNQSIVLRLTPAKGKPEHCSAWRFLFSGDAGQEAWAEMTGDPKVKPKLAAAVLKIPHHGSATLGISDAGAAAVGATYAVNMVGQTHGIPDAPTLKLLRTSSTRILCTQRNNDAGQPSACRKVPAAKCPAKNDPRHVVIEVDTDTGTVTLPGKRVCRNAW